MRVCTDIRIGPVHTMTQIMEGHGLVATQHQTAVYPSQGMSLVCPDIRNRMELCRIMIEISQQGNSKWEMEGTEVVLIRR
jgi:hypothetical protein